MTVKRPAWIGPGEAPFVFPEHMSAPRAWITNGKLEPYCFTVCLTLVDRRSGCVAAAIKSPGLYTMNGASKAVKRIQAGEPDWRTGAQRLLQTLADWRDLDVKAATLEIGIVDERRHAP